MFNFSNSIKEIFKSSKILAFLIVMIAAGLVLWADVPGPKPDLDVRVESFSPNGTTERNTNISIKFSNALVPADSINKVAWNSPVSIVPPIEGMARWSATNILTIYPSRPLSPATKYIATISSGGGYVNGNAIQKFYKFGFHTYPLSIKVVQYRAQRSRDRQRQARLIFDIDANYAVDRDELKRMLRVIGKKDATLSELTVIWPDTSVSGSQLPAQSDKFRLATGLFDLREGEQQYQLVIHEGLKCSECGTGLGVDYTFNMQVPQNPQLDLTIETVQGQRAGQDGSILVQFSGDVPTKEIYDYITMEPPVSFTASNHWRGVLLRGDFKARTTYTVTILSGLMSSEGALLEKNFSSRVIMGDLQPSVKFTTQGIYLPKGGNRFLEVGTVNIDTLSIEVSQIFANNLVPYLATESRGYYYSESSNEAFGRTTFLRDFALEDTPNEELNSTIDIGKIVGDTLAGVFVVNARSKSSRWVADSRKIMMTDIGIMARMSEKNLLVWTNSLSEAAPLNKAGVKLFSKNNQLLLESRTNSKGVAVFTDIADQIEGFEPFLISVEKDGDLSFLRLDNSRLPTSDFDVSGRPFMDGGYEAFIYNERGVYRPGETAHLVSVVRGENGTQPESFPYLIKIVDPRGRVFREYRMTADNTMGTVEVELPADIPTGRYVATAYLSDKYILGRTEILVEEFVPDRIKVSVQTDRTAYQAGDNLQAKVNAQMLFGAPAAGLKVTAEIVFTPKDFRSDNYKSYTFNSLERKASVTRVKLGESILSGDGTAEFNHVISDAYRPPGYLSTQVWATVTEHGGRAVSSYMEVEVHPYRRYVGIKTKLDGYAKVNEPVQAGIVLVSRDGQPAMSDSIRVTFSRVVYNSMLQKQPDGSYRYVSERSTEPIDTVWLPIGVDGNSAQFTPHDYGHYQIVASDFSGGHAAGIEFYATGWGQVPWSLSEPDRLQLDLDKTEYSPGMRAKLQIRAPFSGQLLVTIENKSIQEYLTYDLPENTGEIEIPVQSGYSPNVYITATLIRPAKEVRKHTPARAFGIVPLKVTLEEKRLKVSLKCPEEIKPNSTLNVNVATGGTRRTQLTIAAVDEGILQLTDFQAPDPFGFFYGKRRPALEGYDLYSLVYPEIERATSHLSPSGDMAALRSKRHLNPFQAKRVKAVSLWSGVITADSTGNAKFDFKIPQFNGQLTLMAAASDGDRFGSGSKSVIVREPIIIQESFPRFVAPGDKVQGLVTIFNGLDTAANISVNAEIKGPANLISDQMKSVNVKNKDQGAATFPFTAGATPGTIEVQIRAKAGSEVSHASFELSNRPAVPLSTQFGSGAVNAGSPVKFKIPGDWVSGTEEYVLRTSSLSALQLTRNIEYLLRYPYGCVEQTTSALFPLLYFNDLARVVRPELFRGKGHEYFIAEGIEKLLRFQQSDGAFTYWPGAVGIHNWSSIYAAHFLVEAKLAGYDVDNAGYKRTIGFLENIARNKNYSDIKTEDRIYACLALAKAGKLDKKLFNYLSDQNTKELPPFAAYQLGAALALAGDIERAKEIIPFEIQPDISEPESGGSFSSGARTNAILLDLIVTIDPESPSAAALAKNLLSEARLNRWYNTQATSFALMALGKFFSKTGSADFTGNIRIEGQENIPIGVKDFALTSSKIGGKEITIDIQGKGTCFFYWQASGVLQSAVVPEYDRGLVVRREYLDQNGILIDPLNVALGSQLIGHISIESGARVQSNIVIADLLPAGFEIENPRLEGTAQLPRTFAKMSRPEYQDIRDDRILLFVHLQVKQPQHFYYGVRVISQGDFIVPPVAAECMYNPLVSSSASSGRVTIKGN